MPIPSLIVGLGGTGQWTTVYVKKALLDSYGGIPKETKLVSFDTLTNPEVLIGGHGEKRSREHTTGAIGLDTGEYVYIGKDVKQLTEDVASEQPPNSNQHPYSHIRSWYLADYYLRNLPDHMFSIKEGAGQFRQFGRLAIFTNVAQPANSEIYNTLQDAIIRLQRNSPGQSQLQVFIIGSLAGGTGAGMFVDIAHLIRQIATQSNINYKPTIRGYLVLPDSFSQDVEPTMLRNMYARAFAAMRENRRFTINFDYVKGYPMHYHNGGGDPIWHGAVKGRLFDMVYYIDGQRKRSSLVGVSMKRGVAPTIADTIMTAIDGKSGPTLVQHAVNVEQEAVTRKGRGVIKQNAALSGSIGTYSIIFPIMQIVEGWAHRLGLDILDVLLATEESDSKTGLPISLKRNANGEQSNSYGRDEATSFLASSSPISYGGTTIEPTLLMSEIARIAKEGKSQITSIVTQLTAKDISAWNEHFVPESNDPETKRIKERVQRILDAKLTDDTKTSDEQKPEEAAILGAERIADDARRFKNRYLGTENASSGQREGGQYRETLSEFTRYHVGRFNRMLDLKILATLNGRHQNPMLAKGGKLGYLRDFLEGLHDELVRTRMVLEQVRETRQKVGDTRKNAIAAVQAAGNRMEKAANEKAGFADFGRTFRNAVKAQKDYIDAEVHLIDILKVEVTEEAVLDVVLNSLDYVESAQAAVVSWTDTLAFNQRGLFSLLQQGESKLQTDRDTEDGVAVRKVVSDSAYEVDRYNYYLTQGEVDRKAQLLANLNWSLEHTQVSGQPKLNLNLSLTGEQQNQSLLGDRYQQNLALLLTETRKPFTIAVESESVTKYIMQHAYVGNSGAILLAKEIFNRIGVLLQHNSSHSLPSNYLTAAFNAEDENEQNYLRLVLSEISQLSGVQAAGGQGEDGNDRQFVRYLNSEDRFKLTFLWMEELIDLDSIASFKNGRGDYLGSASASTRGDRRLLHIFPAEVNAAEYENRLPELRQTVRIFSDDVTLQLEMVERVKLFLLLYGYGILSRGYEQDKSGSDQAYWRLVIPPEREFNEFGDREQETEIRLTKPGDSRLLNALKTFNFDAKDVRHTQGHEQAIVYSRLENLMKNKRGEDAKSRVEAGTAGQRSLDLQAMFPLLEGDPTTLGEVQMEAARLDGIRELQARFEKRTLPTYLAKLPHSQDDYDLVSIFILMIRDEVRSVRDKLINRIESIRRTGVIPQEQTHSVNPSFSDADYDDAW